MTSDQLAENIEDILHRLRATYDICVAGYNRAMFKQLSHSLRYWADMKVDVSRYVLENKPATKFWSSKLDKGIAKALKEKEYVIVSFPKAIITSIPFSPVIHGRPGAPKYDRELILVPVAGYQGEAVRFSAYYRKIGPLLVALKHFVVSYNIETEPPLEINPPLTEKRYFTYYESEFNSWLAQEVVRVNKINSEGKLILHSITREKFIRRVADKWGGSHPQGAIEIHDTCDEAIEQLMQFKVADRPLPFLILLKIAQDILDEFNFLEGSLGSEFVFSKFTFPPENSLIPLPDPDPSHRGPFSSETQSLLRGIMCNKCGVERLIQLNLVKGAPLQIFAGAEMYPKNDILECLGCKQELNLKPLRDEAEALQGHPIFLD